MTFEERRLLRRKISEARRQAVLERVWSGVRECADCGNELKENAPSYQRFCSARCQILANQARKDAERMMDFGF